MVAKVFKDMTSEGGKFYNMQAVQAETLKGKISNLKDAYEMMLNEIGRGQSEKLKDAVDWARKLMQNYEETGRVLVELIATYGIYKTTLIAMEVATNSFALANHKLITSLVSAGKYLLANPYVAVAAAITGVAYALYKQHTALEGYQKIQKEVAGTQSKYIKELSKETAKLDALYAKLKLAKKGTEEYNEARKEIYSQYAGYISELRAEGKEVSDLAGIYDALKQKIEDATRARTSAKAQQRLSETYDQQIDAYYDEYIKVITNAQKALNRQAKNGYAEFSEFEKAGFWKYLTGAMTMWDLESTQGLERVVNLLNNANLDAAANLKKLRRQITATTEEYNKSLKEIKKAYGEFDGKGLGGTTGGFPTPEGEQEDATKKIQAEIDAVRRLKDAYDALAPYMNGEMLRKTLTALFPNADQQLIESLDFRGKLVELAGQLNQFDQEASQKLLDSISGEKASEIASTFKAIEQYKKAIDSWMGEDFNLTGEGVTFDISKIIRDLNNQYAKINEKAIKASDLLTKAQMGDEEALKVVREVYGEEVWQKYLTNGKAVIDELARKEREASRKTADEKIRDLASKYVKEQMDEKNIDLSDFEDKSIAQVQSLIDRMNEIKDEAKKLADEALVDILLGKIDDGQYARWQMLLNVIEQVEQKIEDVQEEKDKKQWDNVIAGAESVSQLSEEFINLGEAIGNTEISKLGNNLKKASETFAGVLKAFEAKDTISMITNLVSYAISEISSIFTAVYDHQKALNDALKEYRDLILDIRRESYSGIFGTDEMALAAENAKILAEQQKLYEEQVQKVQKVKFQKFGGSFWRKDSIEGALQEAADSQGWDLFLENGTYNIKALEAYFDAYSSSLTKKQRDIVQDLIESGKALDDASAQQAQYLTDLFSGVADNIASSMVDAFIESGNAAADMGNIISDVAKQMVADLIKSVYLMPILNKYQEKAKAIEKDTNLSPTQKTEAQLALLDNALREISLQSTAINDTIERFEGYFDKDKVEGNGLGDGIKGLTEDTASLLASYINAMRADLSLMKGLQAKYLPIIGESMPTLLDYLARIQANTFDLAQSNAEILQETQKIAFELQSVMGFGDEGRAIRILS